MNVESKDAKFINRCLTIAKKGFGKVNPNPYVGSVIVKNDKIIAEGWHEEFGGLHAEPNAINNASESVKGATLYCNLEPCCHTEKKTPPCTDKIISAGISRVVIANIDPNPEVAGKGIKQLQNAGIEVKHGILKEKGNELNKFFFYNIKNKLPYVTIKIAQTLNSKISTSNSTQKWITGVESKKYVHKLRSIYDAVLVGANTIFVDDPLLNVRYGNGRDPKKIIIDGKLSIPLEGKILDRENISDTYLFTGYNVSKSKMEVLKEKKANVFQLEQNNLGELNLKQIMKILGMENITSVLVEGGNKIFSQFIEKKIFNEIIYLIAPKVFGKGLESFQLNKNINLSLESVQKKGDDVKIVYKNMFN